MGLGLTSKWAPPHSGNLRLYSTVRPLQSGLVGANDNTFMVELARGAQYTVAEDHDSGGKPGRSNIPNSVTGGAT